MIELEFHISPRPSSSRPQVRATTKDRARLKATCGVGGRTLRRSSLAVRWGVEFRRKGTTVWRRQRPHGSR
jgi:hypothetical protein